MTAIVEGLIIILILLGTFLSIAAAVGVVRLPDVYTRNHAASKSTTLGVISTLLGTFIYFLATDGIAEPRVLLGALFILITAPVGGHLISRAAYHSGVQLSKRSVRDDLKDK